MIKRTGALMVIITALSGCSNQGKHQLFSKKLNNENNIIRIKPNFGSHLDKAEDELRMQLQDVDVSIIRKYDRSDYMSYTSAYSIFERFNFAQRYCTRFKFHCHYFEQIFKYRNCNYWTYGFHWNIRIQLINFTEKVSNYY